MRNFLAFFIALSIFNFTEAQVGVNTNTPEAALDISSSDSGILIPRVALSNSTSASPIINPNTGDGNLTNGTLIYNTATAGDSPNNVTEGFYFWNNNQWNKLYSKAENKTVTTGVQYYSYDITPQASPRIDTIIYNKTTDKSGYYDGQLDSENAMTTMQPTGVEDGFVIKIVGTYEVKNTGTFNFSIVSDDGSRLYIDGSLIVSEWTDGSANNASGSVNLAKGKHKFEFWYYENSGVQNFSISWGTNPDGNSGVINAQSFTIE